MKWLTTLVCLAAATLPAAGAPQPTADPSQLNSKHQRLRVQVGSIEGGVRGLTSETSDELTRFAVDAPIEVSVPSFIGTGHGPYRMVYAPQPAPKLSASDGLTIAITSQVETFVVRCTRAGVFEVTIDVVGVDGKPKTDTVDIGCIAPARFTATVAAEPETNTQYLVRHSEVRVALAWYGLRDNREVQLLGALPVELPDDSPLEVIAQGADLRLAGLRAAKSPTIISVGQRAKLPIEIVEPKTWTLDVSVTTSGPRISIRARALDAKGRPFAGLSRCELTSVSGAVETPRTKACQKGLNVRDLPKWNADEVCATVLGKRACTAMP